MQTAPRPLRRSRRRTLLTVRAVAALTLVAAGADPSVGDMPGEGFCRRPELLPDAARAVWRSTVLVGSRIDDTNGARRPRRLAHWGSGTVLELRPDEGGPVAVVATAAHVLRCRGPRCRYRVGFATSDRTVPGSWSADLEVVRRFDRMDLALVEVRVPPNAAPAVARLAMPGCRDASRSVLAVGWPNLMVRTEWLETPPADRHVVARRFSVGPWSQAIANHPNLGGPSRDGLPADGVLHNADILPGSSGGPLADVLGQVVGINSRVLTSAGATDGHHYCAAGDGPHEPSPDCLHLAVSSRTVAAAYRATYGRSLPLARCGP